MDLIQNINLWAVLVAAITKVVIGSFWYAPFILGRDWIKEKNFSEADFQYGYSIWIVALLSLIFSFISALAMNLLITPDSSIFYGAGVGALVAIAMISASKANTMLHEKYSFRLFMIHAGYDIVSYTAMGAILGAWH